MGESLTGGTMTDQASSHLPDYLMPLLQPTPSGTAKLIAAWDGLSTETQILVLTEIKQSRAPAYLLAKVYTKALGSSNSYIRYLAARELRFSAGVRILGTLYGNEALRKRIEEDPDPLVRYSLVDGTFSLRSEDPDHFFALPQEARLAIVRELTVAGERVAQLICHVIDHQFRDGTVSEVELFELLSDYVNKAGFKAAYGDDEDYPDGVREYIKGRDIESLWTLVLKLPESTSHVLIEHLPPGAGLSPGIPEDVIQGMNDRQLTTLLSRQDIELPELRKRIFFEGRVEARAAAICCHFDLTYQEFAQILAKPEKERAAVLTALALWASDLTPCFYGVIHDVLCKETQELSQQAAVIAEDKLQQKLSRLKGEWQEQQLRDLRLYRLAKSVVPW